MKKHFLLWISIVLVVSLTLININFVLGADLDELTSTRIKNLEMNEKRLTKPNLQIDKTRPTGFVLNQAMPREGCIEVNQAFFNGLNTNLRLNYTTGCVELVEDINFRYSIIVEDGRDGFYLTCNNHKITGYPEYNGIKVWDSATVKNYQVENYHIGFQVYDNAKVIESLARNNSWGFLTYSFGNISGSSAQDNINGGFMLDTRSSADNSNSRYNGQSVGEYGIKLTGTSQASNILSDTNENGVYVDANARLLEGYRICGNDNYNVFVNGGYVEGRFQTGPISGAGNWQNAVIVPCGGGDGSSPLFLKAEQQGEIGQSPKNNDWTAIVIAIVALILIFVIYRNFSAIRQGKGKRINKDRMNYRRRP